MCLCVCVFVGGGLSEKQLSKTDLKGYFKKFDSLPFQEKELKCKENICRSVQRECIRVFTVLGENVRALVKITTTFNSET